MSFEACSTPARTARSVLDAHALSDTDFREQSQELYRGSGATPVHCPACSIWPRVRREPSHILLPLTKRLKPRNQKICDFPSAAGRNHNHVMLLERERMVKSLLSHGSCEHLVRGEAEARDSVISRSETIPRLAHSR